MEDVNLTDFMNIFHLDDAYQRVRDIFYEYAVHNVAAYAVDNAVNDMFVQIDMQDPNNMYVIHGTMSDATVYELYGRNLAYDANDNLIYNGTTARMVCHVSVDKGLCSYGGEVDFADLESQLLDEYMDDKPIVCAPIGLKTNHDREGVNIPPFNDIENYFTKG